MQLLVNCSVCRKLRRTTAHYEFYSLYDASPQFRKHMRNHVQFLVETYSLYTLFFSCFCLLPFALYSFASRTDTHTHTRTPHTLMSVRAHAVAALNALFPLRFVRLFALFAPERTAGKCVARATRKLLHCRLLCNVAEIKSAKK